MPFGVKPVCSSCGSSNSTMWSKNEKGEVTCNECVTKQTQVGKESNGNGAPLGKKIMTNVENVQERVLRKSSRNKPSKYRVANSKPLATKGKSRRIIFKKSQPVKAPTAISTTVTGESIFFDGIYYQVGDIVSLVDNDGGIYYAQIRGFLQDQYYEKSAVITWLLPSKMTTTTGAFDPTTYILGPEEDLPRKMEFLEFVCHAPSDYFKANSSPYYTQSVSPELCFVWSSLGPEIRVAPQELDRVFGPLDGDEAEPLTVLPVPKKGKADRVRVKEEKKLIVVE